MELTREQKEECKSVFSLFDRKNNQTIASTDIGLALRGLRVSISDAELKLLADDVERNKGGSLTLEQFTELFASHSRDILTPDKLQGYFAALDTSRTGKIRVTELKNALLNQNEHISEPEIDEILKDFGTHELLSTLAIAHTANIMGATCGMVKNNVGGVQTVALPIKKAQYHNQPTLSEMKKEGIGPYFEETALSGPKRDRRVAKWTSMVTRFAFDDFPLEAAFNDTSTRETLRRRVIKGPPQQFRWQAWTALRTLSYRVSEEAYEQIPLAEDYIEDKIRKDIERTFPEEAYLQKKEGQETLARILSKFARKHESVSYCQGMNFIVAFMLLVSGGREVEVFYMFEDLMESFQGFFSPGFPYLRQCVFVLAKLIQKRLQHVWEALERTEVGMEVWAAKWFMTLFTAVTPFHVTVRIWDLLMTDGVVSLFRAGIALLRLVQMDVIGHDLEDLVKCFEGLKTRDISGDEIARLASKSKLSTKHLRQFEKVYSKEEPEVQEYPSSPRPIRKRMDSEESKEIATSTSGSIQTLDASQSVGSSVDASRKRTQVPILPSIARTYCEMEDYEDAEFEDLLEDDEPVNARDVLEDLLQDQNCSVLSLDSISNLPRPKSPEVDKIISFVNKLPY